MRDWRLLRGASFRGAPFHVRKEELADSGRLVAEHKFAKAETHATEDMARKAKRWKVSGYVVGDLADAEAQALIAACNAPGAATLVLPFLGSHEVRCTSCHVGHEIKELGMAPVELEFIEKGNDSAFAPVPLGDRIAAGILEGLGSVIGSALRAFTR